MIDYEKLKIAHELCNQSDYTFQVEFGWEDKIYIELFEVKNGPHKSIGLTDNLDNLIIQLKKLCCYPEPKFKPNDKVWTCFHEEIKQWLVDTINWEEESSDYRVELKCARGKGSFLQKDVYASKEELIEEQIAYWHQLKMQCMLNQYKPEFEGDIKGFSQECHHESDGIEHVIMDGGGSFSMNRCKKCGEFYR